MAKNHWDDDPDVAAMRGSMRPRGGGSSWGRILFGVLIVACGTFGFAYYLPLHRAHGSLVGDHARLRAELENAQSSVKQVQGELKTATEKRDELQAEKDKRDAAKQALSAGAESVRQGLLASLEKPAKKKQALVGMDDGSIRVALSSSFVFSTGKLEVSGSGKDALCAIAKAAGSGSLKVRSVAAADDIPAALRTKFESDWEYNGAAAASVAEELESKCSVPSARLSTEGTPGAAASPAFAGEKAPTPRVEILLGAKKP